MIELGVPMTATTVDWLVHAASHSPLLPIVGALLDSEKMTYQRLENGANDLTARIGIIWVRSNALDQLSETAGLPVIQLNEFSPIDWALFKEELLALHHRAERDLTPNPILSRLVGQSDVIKTVISLINKLETSDVNVLITGESGTGKEVVAKLIHQLSDRKNQPFVPVNCGAIPQELLESELFGHEKGAFTGAIQQRIGRFELANGGTLFLDEIGDMPLDMQVKILRVLQEQAFERVGGNKTIKVNVRIIAATHCDLEQAITAGSFREDLYYRLNVYPIHMPKLSERSEDIPTLIQQIMLDLTNKKKTTLQLSRTTIAALKQYAWPGNIRELKNLLERLAVLFPDRMVLLSDLPDRYQTISLPALQAEQKNEMSPATALQTSERAAHFEKNFNLKTYLNDMEKNYILSALNEQNGIVAHAAKQLGMQRTTLIEKIRKYQIER